VKTNMIAKFGIMGGCGSSGTTLLTHLISRSKYICSGPEFNCFNHPELYNFPSFVKNFESMYNGKCLPNGYIDVGVFMTHRQKYDIDFNTVKRWITLSNESSSFINQIIQHITNKHNTPYFIEKSPTNVYCFDTISKKFPQYYLIHVIRDGRDVVASLMRRGFNLFGAGSRWLFDTLSGLKAQGTKNYIEIRYEELVSNPHNTLKNLFEQLGVPFDSQTILSGSSKSQGQYDENWKKRKEPQVWQQTPSDPVSTSSIGRYKRDLCQSDLEILYRIRLTQMATSILGNHIKSFADLLQFLNYELDYDNLVSEFRSSNKIEKISLQTKDYFRRFKRFHDRYLWRLPPIFTYIGSKHPPAKTGGFDPTD